MALCMDCGAVMHNDEVSKHKCNPEDVPKKGETFREVFNKEVVVDDPEH